MTPPRSDLGELANLAPGLSGSLPNGGMSVAGELLIVPGHAAYVHIPAHELRGLVDGVFPSLAKNHFADTVTGWNHRYIAGHDLLLDVPRTIAAHGPYEGLRHAGHIVLTDFPTKAGIPIPGFSETGLGHLLEQAGISSGWLQMSVFDTGIGIFALADGVTELSQAVQGLLLMDLGTACHTFGTGTVEITLAIATENPILLAGGVLDFAAGIVSTWQTYSVYVDPLVLLDSAGVSALLGLGLSYALANQSLSDAVRFSVRSGVVGAMYSISTAFGLGTFAGLVAARAGQALAERHNRSQSALLSVDLRSYRLLVEELCKGNVAVAALANAAAPRLVDSPSLLKTYDRRQALAESDSPFTVRVPVFDARSKPLPETLSSLSAESIRLCEDPPALGALYRAALRCV